MSYAFIKNSAGSGSKFAGFGSGSGMRVSGSCRQYPSAMLRVSGRVVGFSGRVFWDNFRKNFQFKNSRFF